MAQLGRTIAVMIEKDAHLAPTLAAALLAFIEGHKAFLDPLSSPLHKPVSFVFFSIVHSQA